MFRVIDTIAILGIWDQNMNKYIYTCIFKYTYIHIHTYIYIYGLLTQLCWYISYPEYGTIIWKVFRGQAVAQQPRLLHEGPHALFEQVQDAALRRSWELLLPQKRSILHGPLYIFDTTVHIPTNMCIYMYIRICIYIHIYIHAHLMVP